MICLRLHFLGKTIVRRSLTAVSYTHLDVYKRQVYMGREQGKYSEYLGWVLVDALVMLVCYLIFYWKKFDWVLIVVPIGRCV